MAGCSELSRSVVFIIVKLGRNMRYSNVFKLIFILGRLHLEAGYGRHTRSRVSLCHALLSLSKTERNKNEPETSQSAI